jgi:hypothetical protein
MGHRFNPIFTWKVSNLEKCCSDDPIGMEFIGFFMGESILSGKVT